ncbi:MAG: DUF4162 domain-containing protein [Oscillospiraceae bacterium]|nr:DUF4162 domain-containing protein [Oscillospiraceae bacterium]
MQGNLRQIKAGYGHTKLLLGAPEEACAMALAAGLSVAESRENETVFLLPSADADAVCAKLLQAIVAKGIMPLKFVLSEPTLHEIFIKEVSNVEERGAAA